MAVKKKYFYPVTPETMHAYASALFTPIRRGECATAIWVSMAGRRMWSRFIIENIRLFQKELPEYQNYLLVYIEPLDLTEESLAGYLRLMGKSLLETCQKKEDCGGVENLTTSLGVFQNEAVSYNKLLETLKSLIAKVTNKGFRVAFFLGEFDELDRFANSVFYNNLKSLWDNFQGRLHYIFLSVKDLTSPENTEKLGELNAATLQNVIYMPIPQGKDREYIINFIGQRFNYQLINKEKELVTRICGGHPYMMKAAIRIIANFKEEKTKAEDLEAILKTHYEMLSVARRIFNLRAEGEKEVLSQISWGRTPENSQDLDRLLKLGLVVKNGSYKLFGELFTLVAKDFGKVRKTEPSREANGLYIDEKGGTVSYGGVPVEEKFTTQEYNIVKSFLEQPGKLISRDEISQVLWGKESYDKYSDWAIDQLMSKLRKKFVELGTRTRLVTLRGRGYKLTPG